jgi:hypothetical protein
MWNKIILCEISGPHDEYEDGCLLGPDDRGNKLLLNVGQYLPGYTAQHLRRQQSSDEF